MRRLTDDRGAVAVIVALLTTVLFGFAALAVDMARLHQERRDLQNGADAGALALAQSCGDGDCGAGTLSVLTALAAQYANGNARDGASNVQDICGVGAAALAPCATGPTPSAAPGNGYVRVRTRTGSSAGQGAVPSVLAEALVGDDYQGTVNAYGIAAWGAASRAESAFPVTFDACEWATYTNNGARLAAPPPYPNGYPVDSAGATYEVKLALLAPRSSTSSTLPSCGAQANYADLPGGFGWIGDQNDGECPAYTDEAGGFPVDTGINIPQDCPRPELRALVGTTIYLPVFNAATGTGGNGRYDVEGYAAFFLTGFNLSGNFFERSIITGQRPCSGSDRCLIGFFTSGLVPSGGQVSSSPNMGASTVQLVG